MLDIQKKENAAQDISGLALALMLDELSVFYCELFGFCENKSRLIEIEKNVPAPSCAIISPADCR